MRQRHRPTLLSPALVAAAAIAAVILPPESLASRAAGEIRSEPVRLVGRAAGAAPSLSDPAVTASNAGQEPAGRLVDVDGRRMHIICAGRGAPGAPTVIIEAGAGGSAAQYRELQESLAAHARVCAYDRAGLGHSEPATTKRTVETMARELRALLHAARVEPPWVLLGHSLGGHIARVSVDLHGDEVAGVVLAEAAHEQQWEELPFEALLAVEAAIEGARRSGDPEAAVVAAELQAGLDAGPRVYRAGDLGDLPLAVVSARDSFAAFAEVPGIPREEANQTWIELQRQLVTLSTRGVHLVSETGDHRIHLTDPGLVVEAVRHVLQALR